jgi:hypothetical protein
MNSSQIDLDALVLAIHAAPVQFVSATTGGGSRAIADLLERPGGSKVLLEAIVPYSAAALVDFLQARPEQFCSARTARLMAMAAYQRARLLYGHEAPNSGDPHPSPLPGREGTGSDGARNIVGVGCTASLASDRPKRGDHRIHVAYQTRATTAEFSLVLAKGRRTRAEEEAIAAALILNATSDACGGLGQLDLGIRGDEPLQTRRAVATEPEQQLLHGERRQAIAGRTPILPSGVRRAVFPGAFNPLHDGHRAMARLASQRLELPVEYELSVHNVDKPPLDYLEMSDRAAQFNEGETLWFTRAPTFDEKSRIFPDATFIVGADTIARIADPAYYGSSERAMLAAIERVAQRGGRFLVFGRAVGGAEFHTLAALDLPPPLVAICEEVPEGEFRADVSSTQLRHEADAG